MHHYNALVLALVTQASSSKVSVTLKNTGSMDGAEVPQLYLQMPASAGEPPKQLKGTVPACVPGQMPP